jgi:hypothetical protein
MFRSRSEESEPALIAPETLVFVLLGAFLLAYGGIRLSYESGPIDLSRWVYGLCIGMMAMGVAFIAIGLGMGRMALKTRSATPKVPTPDDDRSLERKL